MKTIRILTALTVLSLSIIGLSSFKKSTKLFYNEYDAQLVSTTQVGTNYEWIWSVTNPNPGNGTNGTLQNLSHWSIVISDFVNQQNIIGVAYSTDGVHWTALPSTMAIDKSQECYRGTVLKFDQGTSGSAPTYYKLILDQPFSTGYTLANFKSGAKTGCYNGTVLAIGTAEDTTIR